MEFAAILARVQGCFPDVAGDSQPAVGDPWVTVAAAAICDVCTFLRDEPELRFDCLTNQSGLDLQAENKLQVVYHLFSYTHRHQLVLKVDTPRENAVVPTVESVWPAANWLEREIYDLFGIVFSDHTDLRRIMLPDDWVGHPLRKDYVEQEHYHGIATRRESLLR